MSYPYQAYEARVFERSMRASIIQSAIALNASGVDFATFADSRGNEQLWSRTHNGGLLLKGGILPSVGIIDIYQNGHLYAFECATAMVIVLYRATIDAIGEDAFNQYFTDLFLWDWHYNSNLKLISTYPLSEASPGDIVYFKNPDHAPSNPEWQGENAIILVNGLYYGHGIGVTTAEGIITALNRKRIPGSSTSAYLTDQVLHPDFEYLRNLSFGGVPLAVDQARSFEFTIFSRIGTTRYIHKPKIYR